MRMRRVLLVISLFMFECLIFASSALPGTLREEFDSPKLNENFWAIFATKGASWNIKDGKLTMTSPSVPDGIALNYIHEIPDVDVTCEASIQCESGRGKFSFADWVVKPGVNTDLNPHLLAQMTIEPTRLRVYKDLQPAENVADTVVEQGKFIVYKFEIKSRTITASADGKEVAKFPKVAKSRYLFITPDEYTSHYSGTFIIDYIEISGPSISASPVASKSKLATSWGRIKARRQF